jgi:hypothetical protein
MLIITAQSKGCVACEIPDSETTVNAGPQVDFDPPIGVDAWACVPADAREFLVPQHRWLFFANRCKFHAWDYEEIMHRSCCRRRGKTSTDSLDDKSPCNIRKRPRKTRDRAGVRADAGLAAELSGVPRAERDRRPLLHGGPESPPNTSVIRARDRRRRRGAGL